MILSEVMVVSNQGILLYIGYSGELYEIIGGKDGELNLMMP
jgi:hypothetical protein